MFTIGNITNEFVFCYANFILKFLNPKISI